jgi:hypothetical protein
MVRSITSLLLLLAVNWISSVNTYSLTDENNLQTTLMSGYKTSLRPGVDRSIPLEIRASFHLFFIKEFEEYSGKFTVNGVFYLEWFDERLEWNTNSYNGLEKTTFFQTEIWLPNLININPFNKIFGLGSDMMTIDVYASGQCIWIPYQSFDVICDADVTKYPFDTQYCTLNFFIWGHKNDSVKMTIIEPEVGFALYKQHGLWDITKTTVYTKTSPYGHDEVIVGLWIKRRSAFYIASLIIPMFSIGMLMGFVFFLPPEAGERVGFITTVLLSYIVFLTIIQDKLPESSEPGVSIIGYILVVCVLNGTLTTLMVILSLKIHHSSDEKPIPRCIVCFVKRRGTRINNIQATDSKSTAFTEEETPDEVTWSDVGKTFDRLCMFLCTMGYVLCAVIYFCLVLI